jgi:hypothetical protein
MTSLTRSLAVALLAFLAVSAFGVPLQQAAAGAAASQAANPDTTGWE